jgi:multiple sugar transport system substrate-binding protein
MKRKSILFAISLFVVMALVLGACAPAAEEPAAEAPVAEEVAEEPAAEEAMAEDISLRWRTRPDNQAEIDVYSGISDDLDAALDGITLTYEAGGSETSSYQDVLKTEIGAGTAPDVFWIPGTDVADFATRGLILNMADMSEGFDVDAFYPGPMYHLTYNPESDEFGADSGAFWGLPRDASTFALYLNLDLLAEAGLTGDKDPRTMAENGEWTWEAFLEAAQKVRALGSDIYGYGASAWWGPYGTWMNAAGGGFFTEARDACALDSDASIEGLVFEQALYQEYDVAVPYGEDPEPPFMAGRVGMFQNGRWATPGARANASFNWDVVELPKGPDGNAGNWLFWGAYVVNAKTEHPEEAWALVQALTQADTQAKISALGANIPSRVSQEALDAFLTFTPPDNNQAFLNGLADSPATEGPLWAGSWPEFAAVMDPAIASLMTGATSIDEFKASICSEANKAFGN